LHLIREEVVQASSLIASTSHDPTSWVYRTTTHKAARQNNPKHPEMKEINEMPLRNRFATAFLKSLKSMLSKRSSEDGKNKNRNNCRVYASILSTEKLVLKKGRKIGSVDSGDLSYHLISFEGGNGEKYCSIDVCDQKGRCMNRMVFDMSVAWQITLLLLDLVNEKSEGERNQWSGK